MTTWTMRIACGMLVVASAAYADDPAKDKTGLKGPASFINSADLKWGPAPPDLPKGAQLAVLRGDPSKPEQFTIRLKAPSPPAGFGVRYYAGSTGTTPATGITQGTYGVNLAPGAGATVRVQVVVKDTAVRQRSTGLLVRATSAADSSLVDAVLPVVHVT